MLDRVYDFINDNEFRFSVNDKYIHIINYSRILSLESDRVVVTGGKKRIVFKGEKLTLNKLLDDEVLVSGIINLIEVSYD